MILFCLETIGIKGFSPPPQTSKHRFPGKQVTLTSQPSRQTPLSALLLPAPIPSQWGWDSGAA